MLRVVLFVLVMVVLGSVCRAGTKVGNGDDGRDLEKLIPITNGKVVQARDKAIELLNQLNVVGIRGLSLLLPELRTSELYEVETDVAASGDSAGNSDSGVFHSDMTGTVFARTVALPHSPTRFFPASKNLTVNQLIALQIHEALHRALPPEIREDEDKVTQITLAITSPGASYDRVADTMAKQLPQNDLRSSPPAGPGVFALVSRNEDHLRQPSNVGLMARQYVNAPESSSFPISRMYLVHSDLYPFGGTNTPFGLGLEGSFVEAGSGAFMGPIGISARVRLWSIRDFDIGIWGSASLNTLSADELKNSPFGRDIYTLGVSLRKTFKSFYIENTLAFSPSGQSKEQIGLVEYEYNYGNLYELRIRGGYRIWKLDLGAFAEVYLGDFAVSGGAFSKDFGRFRILSGGPEISYTDDPFKLTLSGRFILDATNDANFDFLGNLMGVGVAQGSIGLSASFFF